MSVNELITLLICGCIKGEWTGDDIVVMHCLNEDGNDVCQHIDTVNLLESEDDKFFVYLQSQETEEGRAEYGCKH